MGTLEDKKSFTRACTQEDLSVCEVLRLHSDFAEQSEFVDPEEYNTFAINFLCERLDFNRATMVTFEENGHVCIDCVRSEPIDGLKDGAELALEDTFLCEVLESGTAVYREDIANHQKSYPVDTALLEAGLKSDFAVPLRKKGEVIGALVFASKELDGIPEVHQTIVSQLAHSITNGVMNASLINELQRQKEELEAERSKTRAEFREKLELLRVNEALVTELRELLDHLSESFARYDLVKDDEGNVVDAVFTMINRAFEKQFGVKAADMIGTRLSDFMEPEDLLMALDSLHRVNQGEEVAPFEYQDQFGNYHSIGVFSTCDETAGVLCVDISRYKNILDRYSLMREEMGAMVFEISPEAKIVDYSTGGLTPAIPESKIIGSSVANAPFTSADCVPKLCNTLARVNETGTAQSFEYSLHEQDGSIRTYRSTIHPLEDGNYLCIVWNITAETQYREMADELTSRFEQMFLHHPVPMFIHNRNTGKIIEVNEACVREYGYSRNDFIGLDVSIITQEDTQTMESMIPDGDTLEEQHFIMEHKLQSGDTRNMQVFTIPLTFQDEDCLFTVAQDKTDVLLAEQAFAIINIGHALGSGMTIEELSDHVETIREAVSSLPDAPGERGNVISSLQNNPLIPYAPVLEHSFKQLNDTSDPEKLTITCRNILQRLRLCSKQINQYITR